MNGKGDEAEIITKRQYNKLIYWLDYFVEEFCGYVPGLNETNAKAASKMSKHCHWLYTKGEIVRAIISICLKSDAVPTHSMSVAQQYLIHFEKLVLPEMKNV